VIEVPLSFSLTDPTATVSDLQEAISLATNVPAKRQKLLNLKVGGRMANGATELCAIARFPETISLLGTPESEANILAAEHAAGAAEAAAASASSATGGEEDGEVEPESAEVAAARVKIERRISTYKPVVVAGPREPAGSKKLLVLDVDYTFYDHHSPADAIEQLRRPYLHEFLACAYVNYDIMIWSATSMKWIEAKMNELGLSTHPAFKLAAYFDSRAMVTVETNKYGVFNTKPLPVLWGLYPQYSAANTIMFDDLRRNFVCNAQTGLRIRPFRNGPANQNVDCELIGLAQYLSAIAKVDDFTTLNHRKWERYLLEHSDDVDPDHVIPKKET
jgi:ubiquitin-like domain-containing CTD phosphatase 1